MKRAYRTNINIKRTSNNNIFLCGQQDTNYNLPFKLTGTSILNDEVYYETADNVDDTQMSTYEVGPNASSQNASRVSNVNISNGT